MAISSAAFDPKSPAVVILTGAGDIPMSWSPVVANLAGTPVVQYDRVGMNGASPDTGPRVADDYLAELLSTIDSSGKEKVVLAGQSFGGILARTFAHRYPERVAGLVLIDATPDAIADEPAVGIGLSISAHIAKLLRATLPLRIPQCLLALSSFPLYPGQRRFAQTIPPHEYAAWKKAALVGLIGASNELSSVAAFTDTVAAELRTERNPTFKVQVVCSRAYGNKWVAMQEAVAERYGVPLRIIDDKYHNIHMVHPELVANIIKEVL